MAREVLGEPAAADVCDAGAAARTLAATAAGGSRVLVVEDDELVRELTAEALLEYGYSVAEAGTAAQALAVLEADAESIGVVIVDLGLPDMRGEELIRRLARRHPELPIVVASGYGQVDLGGDMPADTRVAFVQKPYELDALYATLKDLGVAP
jgi:DNA-binding NtrC family response regulator